MKEGEDRGREGGRDWGVPGCVGFMPADMCFSDLFFSCLLAGTRKTIQSRILILNIFFRTSYSIYSDKLCA